MPHNSSRKGRSASKSGRNVPKTVRSNENRSLGDGISEKTLEKAAEIVKLIPYEGMSEKQKRNQYVELRKRIEAEPIDREVKKQIVRMINRKVKEEKEELMEVPGW